MEKNKDGLFSLLNLRSNYLTGSRFKRGRRLGIIILFLSSILALKAAYYCQVTIK